MFTFVNLSPTEEMGVSCYQPSFDYIDVMIITTLLPFAVLTVWGICRYAHVYCYCDQNDTKRLHELKSNYLLVLLLYSYFILPDVVSTIFRTFSCQDIDKGNILQNEYTSVRRALCFITS